ncbi:MAG: prolyl oligopeptidase family serine peptidase [Chloroflexota bacterium]|jgi:dipeptidyl aminopeptidase/acylaminoacyl peptidase|nr:prolyl oligopeptidase family serine peptidase [Chloroflexota bacterium]MDH5242916.1 prolyl oligopeptidase family serine peptidase [Chloroflexota bacterium]
MRDGTTDMKRAPAIVPYGEWPSPLRIDALTVDSVRLGEPWIDGDDVYWVESRPSEGGRSVLVRRDRDGTTSDLTPSPFDVRTRVHEYGGGAYTAAGGTVVFSDRGDGRLYRLDPGDRVPVPITPEGAWRYADLRFDERRRRFIAVREDHRGRGQPVATIVEIPLDGDREPRILVDGPDFLAAPRLSPDGRRLAWLEWDQPDMPFFATRLRVAPVLGDGMLDRSDLAAGGHDESIAQPEWSPDGVLHLVSDRSGWWNLYRLAPGPRLEPIAPMNAEFADPAWTLGMASYGFLPDGSIVAAARSDGRDRLLHIRPGEQVADVETRFTEFTGLRVGADVVIAIAGSPTEAPAVVAIDPRTLDPTGLYRRSSSVKIDPADISVAEAISFATSGGRVGHALYYPPTARGIIGPEGERPPLVVHVHGGPTSNASSGLSLEIQQFTGRGIAFVDVDYGGSSGYGREYRSALDGTWGVVDVDDCVAAARYLVDRGDVDPARLAIEGGSAGGYTTLRALTTTDVFAAGISRFGVFDLEMLVQDTHKFEARYLDTLVGPYPAAIDRYRERSPIHALDRVACPVLVLQGLDDRVVPPSQAEAFVGALAARGIPYAYIAFDGEGHGFRGSAAIRRTAEAMLSFLAAIFGFTLADDLPELKLPGLAAWQGHGRPPSGG